MSVFCTPSQLIAGWGVIIILAVLGGYMVYSIIQGRKEVDEMIESLQLSAEDAKQFYRDALAPHVREYDKARKDYLDMIKMIQSEQIPPPNRLPDPTVEVVDY